jgi:outer membrane protein OmpA-like peptidoglycan-associated protein
MADFRLRGRSLLVLATLAAAGVGPAARNAFAQEAREGVHFEVGVTGGVHIFAKDSELGVPDAAGATGPKQVAPAFGLRFGVVFHPMFQLELEGLGIPTKDRLFGQSLFAVSWRGQLVYNIAPGQLAHGRLTPFVLAGAGGMSLVSATANADPLSAQKGDTDVFFYGGLGLKYLVSDLVQLRLDGRAGAAPNTKKQGFSPEFEALASVAFVLGGHPPEAAPPPPPPLAKDTDGDGIPDADDKCPNEAGPKENGGCPDKDTDGDGVVDRKDKCPDKAGPVERDGCPEEDKDGDGIVDSKDKCPDEAEDKDGFEDEDGCPDPDNDKDGVPDKEDKCPNDPETKNGYQDEDGCPDEVPVTVKKFTGVVKGINFRRNSADIKASSFPLLKEAVKVFRDYPDLRVEISGHTSTEGKREFNMKLSRKRAEAVKGFLVSAGIDENRIGTVGYGPDKPIADNDTKEGTEKNRRIEFRLLGKSETINNQPEPEDINPSPERKSKSKGGKAKGDAAPADDKTDKAKSEKSEKSDKAGDADKAKSEKSEKKPGGDAKSDDAGKTDKPKGKGKGKKGKKNAPPDEPMP